MGLKAELHLILGFALAVALAAIGLVGAGVVRRFYRVEVVEAKGRAMAPALVVSCARALAKENPDEIDRFLLDQRRATRALSERRETKDVVLGADVDLVAIAVVDEKGEVHALPPEMRDALKNDPLVARARGASDIAVEEGGPGDRFGPNGEALLQFAVPVRDRERERGVLWFALSLERARSLYVNTLAALLLLGATFEGALWFLLYKLLKRRILAPILELSRAMERVRGGDLTARVGGGRQDEIGSLMRAFDETVAIMRERANMVQKLDEHERLEEAHRRLAELHTNLAEAHTALKDAQERLILEEKHASLGRLVRGVAHEINNPLGAASNAIPPLKAALEHLRAALARPDAKLEPAILEDVKDLESACEVIARGVSRAVAIVRDLRSFSRLSAADLATVDLRRAIDEALEACAAELGPDGRIKVDVDVQGAERGKPIGLRAFPTLLTQVFVNLVTNAAQAMEKGHVSISARLKGTDRVRIDVKDDGPGIKPEHQERLFEPFFTTKEAGRGTGLGLALCHGVVQKHGGTIECSSEVGKGTTFSIELPLEARLDADTGTSGSALLDRARDSLAVVAMRSRRG